MDYTKLLCEFAFSLNFEDLPIDTIEKTKLFIADFYAASFAGFSVNKNFNEAVRTIIKQEAGAKEASILFENCKYPATAAAYMNAIYAHGADMDDGNRKAAGHIGAHVIAAVFALGEKIHATWEDIALAINVGYEFFNRIVGAAQPSLYEKGFHSTGVGGGIACAAACAKLLRLNIKEIYASVSLAADQASGLLLIDESGQECKPINAANAARNGIISALLAQKGVDAPINPLESKKGWFFAFSTCGNKEIIVKDLGKDFTINDSYLKLYPTCRHTHCCIDAAIEIRKIILKEADFDWNRIEQIFIYIYPNAIKSAGKIKWPQNVGEAKFSIHYAVAVALCKGNFSLKDLDPTYDFNQKLIIDKIVLIPDSTMENLENGIRGAKIELVTDDGSIIRREVLLPKGEGVLALTWQDVKEKMYSCAENILTINEVDQLIENCKQIVFNDNFESIIKMIPYRGKV